VINFLEEKNFVWNNKFFWFFIILFLVLRFLWAAHLPVTNDEAYYWDWSRHLELSYLDAPPFVAWLGRWGTFLWQGVSPFGFRFFVPVVHVIFTLFLLASAQIMAVLQEKKFTEEHAFSVLILVQLAPVFHLEGILLLPDSGLLLGFSGALFFILRAFVNVKIHKGGLGSGFGFGFFLGLSALSKYHAFPVALGFFVAALILRKKETFQKDLGFWMTSFFTSVAVSSPVWIWNALNDFASFRFQSQHGFAKFSLDFKNFFRYLLGASLYLYPYFFIAMILCVLQKLKTHLSSFYLLCFVPFSFLFVLISFSALGKQALPHWVMPGFFLFIPVFSLEWKPFTGQFQKLWKISILFSIFISLSFPSLLSFKTIQNLLIKTFVFFTHTADPLAQAFLWESLEEKLKNQKKITFQNKPYNDTSSSLACGTSSQNNFLLGSLRWYWTAQMAFYFKNQPRVYNFDFQNSSFYSWRDSLADMAGCSVFIIGSKKHYRKNELEKVLTITKETEFVLLPYLKTELVFIQGTLKNRNEIQKISDKLKKDIHY
jgi:4-amino-4-deoxy-L-arabinose transferase-like glycosyltransferase